MGDEGTGPVVTLDTLSTAIPRKGSGMRQAYGSRKGHVREGMTDDDTWAYEALVIASGGWP